MSKDFEELRLTLVGELGSRYMGQGLPLEAASRQAADLVDRLVEVARQAPVEVGPQERPVVTWDDLKVGRLVVVTDRSGGRPERHDARIVKRGNRVGGRVTLRALTGTKEWLLYIETQRSKDGWVSFRSREQAAWDDRQSAARAYLNEVIGWSASGTSSHGGTGRGKYTGNEVTLANIIRRARGEQEL